jgi:hypothetical protein
MTNGERHVQRPFFHNRIAAVMSHTSRYAFRGTSRLAADSGLSKSTISHTVHGKTIPLYTTVARIVQCLEDKTSRPLDCRELVSEDGSYPTTHICEYLRCSGCLPDTAYEDDGSRKAYATGVKPGQWTGDNAEFAQSEPEGNGR